MDSRIVELPTYRVYVSIRDLRSVPVSVAAADEPFVLLGVDVLNHYRILLDGPNLSIEIT